MEIQELSDKALKAATAGNFDEAVAAAEEIVAAAPEDAEAWLLKGTYLVLKKEHRQALEALDKSIQLDDKLAAAWFQKGYAHEGLGEIAPAISAYTKATELDINSRQAWLRLGYLFVAIGQFANGLPAIRKAIELDPALAHDADAVAALSSALNETGDSNGAVRAISDAIEAAPELIENGKLRFQEGVAQNVLGDREKALAALNKAAESITDSPTLGLVRLQQGLALQALKKHEEAVSLFKGALDLITVDPFRAWLWFHMGRSQVALNDKAAANEALENAARTAEASITDQVQRGNLQSQLGLAFQTIEEHAKAVRFFEIALNVCPDDSTRAWLEVHMARSLVALNDSKAALQALENAAKHPPPDPNFHLTKAGLLSELNRPQEALSDLEQVTTLDPKSLAGWTQKAGLLAALNRPQEALSALEQVTTLNPESLAGWIQKAGLLTQSERFPEALIALEKSIDLAPNGPIKAVFWNNKATVLMRQGDLNAALAALDQTTALDPTVQKLPRFLELRSSVLRGLKRFEESEKLFERAAEDPKLAASPLFLNAWATALVLVGKDKEGFEKLVAAARDPESEDASEWLACGGTRSNMGSFQKALEALAHADKIDPAIRNTAPYLAARSTSLSGLGSYEEALQSATRLVEIAESDPGSHMLRGTALAGLGKHQEALAAFKKAAELAPKNELRKLFETVTLIQQGWVLVTMKEADEAFTAFTTAARLAEEFGNRPNRIVALLGQGLALYLRSTTEKGKQAEASQAEALKVTSLAAALSKELQGPVPALAWFAKGNILSWQQREEEALIAYQQASQYPPEAARLRLSMGESYERLEDYELAVKAFEGATQIATIPAEKSAAYLGIGRAQHRLEHYEEALRACREAITVNGETEDILELLGTVYLKLHRHNAALSTFRRGRRMNKAKPRSTALALGVSAALLEQNLNADARSFLEGAQKDTPFNSRLHFNYGVALYRLKESGAASRALRKAADMGLPEAAEPADKLEGVGGSTRTWFDFWFGGAAWIRKSIGITLIVLLVLALLPAFLKSNALGSLPWLDLGKDWKVMLIPIILLSGFLLLPILKRVSVKGMDFDISQPDPKVGGPDLDTVLKAFLEAGPKTTPMHGTSEPNPKI